MSVEHNPSIITTVTKDAHVILQFPDGQGRHVFMKMVADEAREIAKNLTDMARCADEVKAGRPVPTSERMQ
ncbi:MAG: hypothetical protein AAF376_18465 [Pseudomonadota bacterium]